MEVVGGSAGGKQNRKNITPEELKSAGVIYEERKLPVGYEINKKNTEQIKDIFL